MKKFLLLVAIILFTTACSGDYLKQLNLKSLEEKITNKETFVLYLTDLSDEGKTLEKTLLNVAKNNDLKTFYLNTKSLNTDDKNKLNELFTFDDSNLIIFVKEGKEPTVLSRIDDTFISEKKLAKELKNQGYLK